jgi:hypothetical protein
MSRIVDAPKINSFIVDLDTGAVMMVEGKLGHGTLTWPVPPSSSLPGLRHVLIFSEQLRARACSLFRRSRWRLLRRRRRKSKTRSGVFGMPRSPSRLRSDAPRIFDPFRRDLFAMGQTGQSVSFFRFGREAGTSRYGK